MDKIGQAYSESRQIVIIVQTDKGDTYLNRRGKRGVKAGMETAVS